MDHFFPASLDRSFRAHPWIMMLCTLVVGVMAFLLAIAQSGRALVRYAGF
jgi:F0F1-type ATP synthase assembly protein I